MIFTQRAVQILFLLLDAKEPIVINGIAQQLQISRRTIFRELNTLNKTLARFELELDAKTFKGLVLEGSIENKNLLRKQLKQTEYFDPRNKDERQKKLIFYILKQSQPSNQAIEPKKLSYYAKLLKVSETTISNDMEAVANWFSENNLKLTRKPGYGVYVYGDELSYRKTIINFIFRDLDTGVLQKFKHEGNFETNEQIFELIEKHIMAKVMKVLDAMNDSRISSLSENSYAGLVIYLSLLIKRVSENKKVDDKTVNLRDVENTEEYLFTKLIIEKLQKEFDATDIHIPPEEIAVASIYLKATKLQYVNADVSSIENDEAIQKIIYEMIDCYDESIAYLLKQDDDFIQSLMLHLKPTFIRLEHNIDIQNPFLEEFKVEHQDIYNRSVNAAKVINQRLARTVPDDEIGLLAMHFGAATIRLKKKILENKKVNIGLVCPHGIGISRLLSSKLKCVFEEKVQMFPMSEADLSTNKLENIHFLISTYPLQNISKDSICINPMLFPEDLKKIAKKVEMVFQESKADNLYLPERVDILDEFAFIDEMHKDVNSIMNNFDVYYVDKEINFKEAVDFIGETLSESQVAGIEISRQLIKREELSTQITPEYEIALLHTKTDVIKFSKFIVIYPRDNTCFENSYFKKAQVIIVMLIPQVYFKLPLPMTDVSLAIFEDEKFLSSVKSGNKNGIRRYLQYYLKQYLTNYLKKLC